MTTHHDPQPPPSAKIYQFPIGGRRGLIAQRDQQTAATDARTPRVSFGAWYHDEAIQDSNGKRAGERS